jgi:PKD repeat protein
MTACLTVAGFIACDKMPLSAPTESTITLYASGTTVGLNASIDITATVIESAGTPVQNGTVVTFTTTLGTIEPNEARTNNGKATVKLVAGTRSGTAEIRAFSGGTSSGDPLTVAVGAAAAGRVDLLANPSTLPAAGGAVQLTAVVNDAAGNRLAGVPVNFATDAGLLTQNSVVTDANGEARTTLTTTSSAQVTATVAGGSSEGGSITATLTIPVRVGPSVAISVLSASVVPGVAATFEVTVTAGGAAVRTATIDFGDGVQQSVGTAGKSTVSHIYAASGMYTVKAVVVDNVGESATAMATVSVQPVVVMVSLIVTPSPVTTTAPAEISASVTTAPAGAIIERYEWDFGDGSGRTISSGTTSHLYASGGGRRYVVTVRAVTTGGASGTAQREIVVQ